MGKFPAVDVARPCDSDTTLALVDDFSPTAVEEHVEGVRIFFALPDQRNAAAAALAAARFRVRSIEVDDEDWARRTQADLKPVTVGRIVVAPPWSSPPPASITPLTTSNPQPLAVVIRPSTGFGTGHHATTRLCLRGLQEVELADRFVLDVGTGSGVLAIAALRLGAARALGIDCDADAIRAAKENVGLNPGLETVEFRVADLSAARLPPADVVTANLTGAFLARSARVLLSLLRPGGTLIVSGLLTEERAQVVRAFEGARLVWEQREDGWEALGMKKS